MKSEHLKQMLQLVTVWLPDPQAAVHQAAANEEASLLDACRYARDSSLSYPFLFGQPGITRLLVELSPKGVVFPFFLCTWPYRVQGLGLLLGTEAPIMAPDGVDLSSLHMHT